MMAMSNFDESLHPRGQAANAGQFRQTVNDAPEEPLAKPARTESDYFSDLYWASISGFCDAEKRLREAQLLAYAAEIKGTEPNVTQVVAYWDDDSNTLRPDGWLDQYDNEVDIDDEPDMTLDAFDSYDDAYSEFLIYGSRDAYPTRFIVPLPEIPEVSATELAKEKELIEREGRVRIVREDLLHRAASLLDDSSDARRADELLRVLREIVDTAG